MITPHSFYGLHYFSSHHTKIPVLMTVIFRYASLYPYTHLNDCCLETPYGDTKPLTVSMVTPFWGSVAFTKRNTTANTQATILYKEFEKNTFKITTSSLKGQWANINPDAFEHILPPQLHVRHTTKGRALVKYLELHLLVRVSHLLGHSSVILAMYCKLSGLLN